jgi:PIN domain nuclease of toxin-antitoxin system
MNLLLDTHTFLWWSLEPDKLPISIRKLLSASENRIVLSVVSSWEAQIKAGLGKLVLEESLETIIRREIETNGWEILPVTIAHTWRLADLPPLHRDPFDRMLITQAITEELSIVTKDPLIGSYSSVRTIWE